MSKAARRRFDRTTDPSLGRRRRRVVSWLSSFVLAFNLFAGGLLPPRHADAEAAPFAQDLFFDRIVISTAGGMVVVDRDGNIVDTDPTSHHADLCAFCLPLMHSDGAMTPVAVVLPGPRPALRLEEAQAYAAPTPPARLAGAALPRGPPRARTAA